MKRNIVNVLTTGVIGLLALFSLVTCGTNQADEETTVVKLGVADEQSEAWEYMQEELKENKNVDLQLVGFTDYRRPTVALGDKSIDLHAALTEIFMGNVNKESGYSNTAIACTALNPLGICPGRITDVSELANGATVALPNDMSNESRALLLLQTAGLVTLDKLEELLPTTSDIAENPKALRFELPDSSQTARVMTDVDISLISNGMAVDAGLVPTEDATFLEPMADSSTPYYNAIAARADEAEGDMYQTVVTYYQTDEVKTIIDEVTKRSSIPVQE